MCKARNTFQYNQGSVIWGTTARFLAFHKKVETDVRGCSLKSFRFCMFHLLIKLQNFKFSRACVAKRYLRFMF